MTYLILKSAKGLKIEYPAGTIIKLYAKEIDYGTKKEQKAIDDFWKKNDFNPKA